jgi:hypothetical protein
VVLYEIYREDGGNEITFVHMLYIETYYARYRTYIPIYFLIITASVHIYIKAVTVPTYTR